VSSQAAIAAGHREAGDSFDFHARHGRALQARAARESMQALLTLFRSRGAAAPQRTRVGTRIGRPGDRRAIAVGRDGREQRRL
jgi:hypothetical protein